MKAALLRAPNEMRLSEMETPTAGPGELVLRVRAACLCGTDLRIISGRKTKGVRFPSVLGHEFSGVIVDVGEGVSQFHLDQAVTMDPVMPCRRCAYCRTGRENVCLNRQAMGYEFDGAFAEYLRIPALALESGNVFAIPEGMSYEAAALAEPLACCLNGQRNAGITLGDDVLILGSGPIGLMHAQLALAAGARNVVVSEPNAFRRQQAEQIGVHRTIDPTAEDPGDVMRSLTDGLGASVVILAIGVAKLANDALEYVRKGGRVNLFAGFSVGDAPSMDVNAIHYNEILISGASALSRAGFEMALHLIANGKIDVEQMISNRFSLMDIDQAVRLAESGSALKVVINNA